MEQIYKLNALQEETKKKNDLKKACDKGRLELSASYEAAVCLL